MLPGGGGEGKGWQPLALRILPPHAAVRARARLQPLRAWLALLVAMRSRRKATELWIGDSHAMTFNQAPGLAMFMRTPDGQIVLRIGARLMWSIAQHGFPPRVHRVVALVSRFGVPGSIVPVFVLGEIDVRCHLAERPPDFAFVKRFVERGTQIAAMLGAQRAVFVVPPPPSPTCPDIEKLPIRGSLEARITAFQNLREAMIEAVDASPSAELLDVTEDLGDASGVLQPDLTADGCHTNLIGVGLVRARAEQLQLTTRTRDSVHPRTGADRQRF